VPKLYAGDEVEFKQDHIIGISQPHPPDCECGADADGPEPICPCCFDTRNDPE
jgi:hypothetical protein